MPHLNELRASYERKGLRILAITTEEPGVVEKFIGDFGISYTVGIAEGYGDWGGGGIPHAYLVTPDGKVAWEGHPASLPDGEVEKLLRKTKDFWIRDVANEAKAAAAAFEKGRMADAERLATELKDKEDADRAARDDAAHVLARVGAVRSWLAGRVDRGVAQGVYDDAFDALEQIQKLFANTDAAKDAAAKEAELKADPKVKDELTASKALDKLIEEKTKAGTRANKLEDVARKVEKFIEKYEGLKAADRAKRLLNQIKNAAHR